MKTQNTESCLWLILVAVVCLALILPHPTYLFSAGFPDHVPPSRGNDLPHHVLIREQHGASRNTGHVSPRRSRRADRGERWMVWAWWWSAESYFHLTAVRCTMIVIHLWPNWKSASELVILSDISQAAVFIIMCFVFLPRLPRWPITPNVRYCATSCLQCLQFSS